MYAFFKRFYLLEQAGAWGEGQRERNKPHVGLHPSTPRSGPEREPAASRDPPPPFMFILQQGKHKGEGHLKGQRAKKVRDKSKRRNPGKNYGKEPEAARGEEETPGRTVKGESATCRSLAAFSGTPATAAPAHLSSCRHRAPTLGAEQTPHPGNRHQPKDP